MLTAALDLVAGDPVGAKATQFAYLRQLALRDLLLGFLAHPAGRERLTGQLGVRTRKSNCKAYYPFRITILSDETWAADESSVVIF
ncbi:hypothetical protein AFL01nite_05140 [Aeromicrobium flavum]|uniref:Uncharacterized protein n=1 Tax=Aeromicrobium flavum TaxID=416568 RepID=A0A512HRV8_9ACTN|nr:hypothetical protein [Aeromicrobium flavum]GEO88187.1 hypothetical protein AFL01nite_05140 [Aeromicrobium flavum]